MSLKADFLEIQKTKVKEIETIIEEFLPKEEGNLPALFGRGREEGRDKRAPCFYGGTRDDPYVFPCA